MTRRAHDKHLHTQVARVAYNDELSSDSEHDAYLERMKQQGEDRDSESGETTICLFACLCVFTCLFVTCLCLLIVCVFVCLLTLCLVIVYR